MNKIDLKEHYNIYNGRKLSHRVVTATSHLDLTSANHLSYNEDELKKSRPNTYIGGSTMCNVKKYNKEVFKVGDIINVICPVCDGEGWYNVTRDEDDYEICLMCHGEGNLEKELRECPHCRELVLRDDLTWVNDRYGIPYKKVCMECYEEVDNEINHYEYDYLDAGEYLEVEDY